MKAPGSRLRRLSVQDPDGNQPEFQVPGLWFPANEIHALLLVRGLLSQLQPGFLAEQLEPFGRRLNDLAKEGRISSDTFALDCIEAIMTMTTPASDRPWKPRFTTYGIYAGHEMWTATLHFDAEASRRVTCCVTRTGRLGIRCKHTRGVRKV
jgi:hypothetical protein